MPPSLSPKPAAGSRPNSRLGLILMLSALTAFGPLAIDMYLPALPRLAAYFNADASAVQLTLATFFVGFAVGQAFYGPITDRFGRKPPLYFSMTLFFAASVACALAPSVEFLTVARLFQALGVAAGVVISRAMVRDLFPPGQIAQVYSTLMLVMGLAPILAPLIGGYLLRWFDWDAIFWVLSGFGFLCLLIVIFRLPETHRPEIKPSLRLGVVLRGYAQLLRDRPYLGFTLCGGLSLGGMFAYIAGSPFVIIELHGISAEVYGWIFGANALGFVIASQINGRLVRRRHSATLAYDGTLVQSLAGLVLLASAATGWGGLIGLLVPLFVYTSCIGFILPNTAAMAMVPHGQRAGVAAALMGTLQFSLAACASAAVSLLQDGTAVPMALVVALGSLGGFLMRAVYVRMPRRPA